MEGLKDSGIEKPDDMPPSGDMPPPEDSQNSDVISDASSVNEDEEIDEDLLNLIEQYQSGSISEEEFLQQAANYGATGSAGSIVNQYA